MIDNEVLISIVTPCKNSVKTIERTINSVITEKKNNNIEYIIIDGGSSDGTLDIINNYSEYIDVVISEYDNGLYDAFNKGIKLTTGKYILVLAADDYLLKGAVSRFLRSVKPGTQVWAGSVVIYYEGYYQYMYSRRDLDELYRCCSLRHPATFFSREVYERFGYYDSAYKIAADREFFLRLYEGGAVFQIEDVPIVSFGVEGVSNKKQNEVGIPEEKAISQKYGLSYNDVKQVYRKTAKKVLKESLKRIAIITHTYRFICIARGNNKFLSKDEITQYGIK